MPDPTEPSKATQSIHAPVGHLTPAWKTTKPGGQLLSNAVLPAARLFDGAGFTKDLLVDAGHIVLSVQLGGQWIFYLHARRQSFKKMLRRKHGKTVVSPKFHQLLLLLGDTAAALAQDTLDVTLHCYEAQSMALDPSEDIANVFATNAADEARAWLAAHGHFPASMNFKFSVDAVDRWQFPVLRLQKGQCRGIPFDQRG